MKHKVSFIIAAAGNSSRFNETKPVNFSSLSQNKVYFPIINNACALDFLIKKLKTHFKIYLLINKNDTKIAQKYTSDAKIILGSKTRQQSILQALAFIKTPYVFIHDGARPFLCLDFLETLMNNIKSYAGIIPYLKINQAIKLFTPESNELFVSKNLNRELFCTVQTPQLFQTKLLYKAHKIAQSNHFETAHDDSELITKYLPNSKIKLILGDSNNLKITTYQDLLLARFLLESKTNLAK